jgi:deoxyribodipyrimidine photo-lyase
MRTAVWFRDGLRLADHLPLRQASQGEVIPLYVLERERLAVAPGGAQFVLDSLRELESGLVGLGSGLLVVEGRSEETVPALAVRWKADRVAVHRCADPQGAETDERGSCVWPGRTSSAGASPDFHGAPIR